MDKQIVEFTLEFMKRVQLQGNEVPAYQAVITALNKESEVIDAVKSTED